MAQSLIPALIFSRMDSSRLPGKALMTLKNVPVLGRVISRLKSSNTLDALIVCTSDRDIDNPIADFAITAGVQVFRGDAHDVLGRANAAAKAANAEAVVRISGDSPFMDPALVDAMVEKHRASPCSLTTNVHPRTYPAGMSVEVIDAAALDALDQMSLSEEDREHVTPYFYRHKDIYKINNHTASPPCRDVDLALDTEEDFRFQSWLATQVTANANLATIVDAARQYTAPMKETAS